MSLDAAYILVYDVHEYVEPSPMKKDITYLKKKFGGSFIKFNYGYSIFWEKPKYTLMREELLFLYADQVLERKDCEMWEIISIYGKLLISKGV